MALTPNGLNDRQKKTHRSERLTTVGFPIACLAAIKLPITQQLLPRSLVYLPRHCLLFHFHRSIRTVQHRTLAAAELVQTHANLQQTFDLLMQLWRPHAALYLTNVRT
ncbi:MAG: hypothetical protein ACRDA1_13925, partial [Plesiomonas shigelloides]